MKVDSRNYKLVVNRNYLRAAQERFEVQVPKKSEDLDLDKKTYLVTIDGTDIVGEVVELSKEIKNLITKIKVVFSDNRIEYVEVKDLALSLFSVVDKVVKTGFFVWLFKLLRLTK